MKQVKTDWRCRLGNEVLDHLIRIKYEGPKNYDPTKAINRWWLAGQRMRRPNIEPYGPHAEQNSDTDSDSYKQAKWQWLV